MLPGNTFFIFFSSNINKEAYFLIGFCLQSKLVRLTTFVVNTIYMSYVLLLSLISILTLHSDASLYEFTCYDFFPHVTCSQLSILALLLIFLINFHLWFLGLYSYEECQKWFLKCKQLSIIINVLLSIGIILFNIIPRPFIVELVETLVSSV